MSAVSISAPYVLTASMDVMPEAEALFNKVYDTERVPNLLQVPLGPQRHAHEGRAGALRHRRPGVTRHCGGRIIEVLEATVPTANALSARAPKRRRGSEGRWSRGYLIAKRTGGTLRQYG